MRRLVFLSMLVALLILSVLRLFRNRWARETMHKLWLVMFLYVLTIFGLGIFQIVQSIRDGTFP